MLHISFTREEYSNNKSPYHKNKEVDCLNQTRKKIAPLLAVTLVLTMIFAGCGKSEEGSSSKTVVSSENPSQTARVATWKMPQTIQPNYYSQYLDGSREIKVSNFMSSSDQLQALLNDDVDACGMSLTAAIEAVADEKPVVIVCGMYEKGAALVVGADSDIQEVADLKGKRIACQKDSTQYVQLLNLLKENELDAENDVTIQEASPENMETLLQNGEIDAYCGIEPYVSQAVSDGTARILDTPYFDDDIGLTDTVLVTTRENTERKNLMIKDLVKGQKMATETFQNDPDLWVSESAQQTGIDEDIIKASLDNLELDWEIDEDFVEQVEALCEKMTELGVIAEVPNDVWEFVDLSFVEYVNQ